MSLSPDKSYRYSGECRNCEHVIDRDMPARIAANDSEGLHIRCKECGTENTVEKSDRV